MNYLFRVFLFIFFLDVTIYWSGLRSFHSQLGWRWCIWTCVKPGWKWRDVTPCDISFNDVCLALFFKKLKYTIIIARAILIYIYIISVVCYGTVKLWLWDKAVCRSSLNMCWCVCVWGMSFPVCSCPSLTPVTPFTNYEKSGKCTEWWREVGGHENVWDSL